MVQAGAALSPGNSNAIGTLSISNSLTLLSNSTTRMDVNAATLACDLVQGLSSVSGGGTLVVSNLAGTPALGQSFQLFSATSASGNFTNLTPQLGGGLRWKFVPASGVLSVVSSFSQPRIASEGLSGASLVLQVTNGPPGGTNYLIASTNVALAVTNWTRLATNKFDVSGNCSFTNAVNVTTPQRFYAISATVAP
ncbi:MAG: hypothetical protein EXS35_17825 [Pedosphaera sp.]|nr:hypothetical protein [Pedosphaera sp.]